MTNEQTALNAALRQSAEHTAEQVVRFIRLTLVAAIPSVADLISGGKFDWKTLLAFILPFAEVAYRQVWPALSSKRTPAETTDTKGLDALTGVVLPNDVGIVPLIVEGPADAIEKVKAAKKAPAKKAPAKKAAAKKTTPKA